jgi:site-specific DNA-methyltransferase (adenine-specific)
MSVKILHGDALELLFLMEANTIDAVVTDPPYGLEFMGKEWDGSDGFRRSLNKADVGRDNAFGRTSARAPEYRADNVYQAWCEKWASECFYVLKPGAHLLVFGGTRTYHRMACAVEDAGFEIRDQIYWIYGQGFPKSRNTALKPAHEPVVLARKPLIGTVAENVAKWGTGALNIDACRIEAPPWSKADGDSGAGFKTGKFCGAAGLGDNTQIGGTRSSSLGRFPANVVHDGSDEVVNAFPDAPGQQFYFGPEHGDRLSRGIYGDFGPRPPNPPRDDGGSAARFFYSAKADKEDRLSSKHPTVKPVDLIAYLCRLITPPKGLVLDPFAGSGTTGMACLREGFDCILIEREAEYVADIERRIAHVSGTDSPLFSIAK